MRFLIAGFGSIGRRHFRNLITLGYKDIILLRSNKSTLDTSELDGFVVETNLEAALEHKPDAVIISNPTALHLDVAIPAARQGCHLFFEKPISDSMDRITELRNALSLGGGKAVTGFQYRFHPGLIQVRKWIDEGKIGKVVLARSHWGEYQPGWHPWEDHRQSYSARKDLGGGVILTLCHPIDYFRWMFGEVKAVFGVYNSIDSLQIDTEAIADINLKFNDVLAHVHLNYIQRPGRHSIEIIGDEGTITWNNKDGVADCFSAKSGNWQKFTPASDFERNTLFIDEMNNFIDYINSVTEPICTLEDGIRIQQIVEAIYKSQIKNQMIELGE
jgi:predicted dehydrogenase